MERSESRKLTDPQELRVLAHPLRLRIMQVLFETDAATATQVAEVVGESPASCSWHLRQLAKHGFVEESPDRRGRQRPWRATVRSLQWGDSAESGEAAAASDEFSSVFVEQEVDGLRRWLAWRRIDPPAWQDAADFAQSSTWLTVEELAEINAELYAIMFRYRERTLDPALRPPGSRQVRMFVWAVPAAPLSDEPPEQPRDTPS